MGLFGSKQLDYRAGDGNLPKVKSATYFPHHLPGQPTAVEMDFDLLTKESNNSKYQELFFKTMGFATTLEYAQGDFDYSNLDKSKRAQPDTKNPGDVSEHVMEYLADLVAQQVNNQVEVYFELLPYLEEFERKIEIDFSIDQRRVLMSLFRVGMGLALTENQSPHNLQGFCHPSISNMLHSPRKIVSAIIDIDSKADTDFWLDEKANKSLVKLALYVGYFQSKYTGESPSALMENINPGSK